LNKLIFKRFKISELKILPTFTMIQITTLVVLTLAALGNCDGSVGTDERYGGHPGWMGQMCMSHCSYICLASAGKMETCLNLLSPTNTTMDSLPDLAACPATTAEINDCFLKCGCQCTRCSVCLMKKLNPMAAQETCKANPDPMKCMMDKREEAVKACN
jgi:hypothetical protein